MERLRPKKEGIPSPGSAALGDFNFLTCWEVINCQFCHHSVHTFSWVRGFLCFVFCRVILIFHHSSCDVYHIVAVTSFVHRIKSLLMSINNLFSLLICSNQHDHQSKSLRFFVGSLDFHPFPIFSSIQNRFIHSKFSHIFASLPEISCLCPLVSVRSPPILEAPNSISFHFIFIFADITSQSHGLPV